MKDSLKIAVAGATGYVGLELVKILQHHPNAKIVYLCAQKSLGKSISLFDKKIKNNKLPKISHINKINWDKINILFTALPNGEAQKIAKILPSKIKLIDLSADFRLKNFNEYKKWYGINHKCKHLIKKSIYAVTEFSKKRLKNYNIISCPGCYPTSVQIPLIPLIEKKMINLNSIRIDSKSGYSGAGKNIKKKFNFKNLLSSIAAYGIGSHRHMSEIDQEFKKASKKKVTYTFNPHVIPTFRGILSTIHLEVKSGSNINKIIKELRRFHKNNFFIKIMKKNKQIGTGNVLNTNFCEISVCETRIPNKIVIFSAIDNLVKGASGQAIQNMNLIYGFKERTGLIWDWV